jgi:hypothetical protein
MVENRENYVTILQRGIAAYEGLIQLYAQDAPSNVYFDRSLSEARTKRNGLQERLDDPAQLIDIFRSNYFLSISHFLDSHRGEYGSDMPSPNAVKKLLADRYLQDLCAVKDEIIRIGRELELNR